jgi:hypothetical protein
METYYPRNPCLVSRARSGHSDRFSSAPESLSSAGRWPADGRNMLLSLRKLEIVEPASKLFNRYR